MPDVIEIDQWHDRDFDFLSNFFERPIIVWGIVFKTMEHFFQWCKTVVPEERQRILGANTPGQAKRLGGPKERGGIATLRPDWEVRKDSFVLLGLTIKYLQHTDLLTRLINTYPNILVEGNWWHDNYWGDCRFNRYWQKPCSRCQTIEGQNKLGKMQMYIRNDAMRMRKLI